MISGVWPEALKSPLWAHVPGSDSRRRRLNAMSALGQKNGLLFDPRNGADIDDPLRSETTAAILAQAVRTDGKTALR